MWVEVFLLLFSLLSVWNYIKVKGYIKEYPHWLLVSVNIRPNVLTKSPHHHVYSHYLSNSIFSISPFYNALSSDVLVTCRESSSPLNMCRISPPQLYHPVFHYTLPLHSHTLDPLHSALLFLFCGMCYFLTSVWLTCLLSVLSPLSRM